MTAVKTKKVAQKVKKQLNAHVRMMNFNAKIADAFWYVFIFSFSSNFNVLIFSMYFLIEKIIFLQKTWLCDGIADCKHADDEANCKVQCEAGQFTCPTYKNSSNARICVNQKHICDGQFDCLQGEDEQNCPTPKKCEPNSKCEQLCITKSNGEDGCACKVGFVLHENKRK